MHTRTWTVKIFLSEDDGSTHAEAVLTTDVGTELRHVASARKHPADREVAEIGDELATCRALSGLAHDLLEAATSDIQANDPGAGQPVVASGWPAS